MGEEKENNETFEAGPGATLDRVIGSEGGTHPEPADLWRAHVAPPPEGPAEEHRPPAHSERSLWPFVVALGLLLVGAGLLSHVAVTVLGAIIVMAAAIGWMWEPWTS